MRSLGTTRRRLGLCVILSEAKELARKRVSRSYSAVGYAEVSLDMERGLERIDKRTFLTKLAHG